MSRCPVPPDCFLLTGFRMASSLPGQQAILLLDLARPVPGALPLHLKSYFISSPYIAGNFPDTMKGSLLKATTGQELGKRTSS